MEKIVKAEVHRLVVVDDDNRVFGVISLSDILSYLVLRPLDENGADSNPCDDPELQVEKPNVSINDEVPSDEKENLQPEPDISTIAIKQLSGDENVINTAVED
jgi:5'-AMP-activated protein kinase regulatory gamma subunit